MRLMTLATYPPMLGGLAVHALELSEYLADAGHGVRVVTVSDDLPSRRSEVVEENGVLVARVPPLPGQADDYIARFERQNVRSSEGVLAHLASGGTGIDLISCHGYFFALTALSLARITGARLVFHAHNMMAADVGQDVGLRDYFAAVEGRILVAADQVIAISPFIAGLCRDLGCADEKLTVIPKALHMSDWAADWSPQQPPTVLFVGRLSPEKGIETLFAAMDVVRHQVAGAQLLIVGAGDKSYAASLRQQSADLRLSRTVAFLGGIATARLPPMYRSASVTVVPSLMEAFGRVAIEAMAVGCPVVVSDVGGLGPLVRHGETGLKVAAGDRDELAAALITAITRRDEAAVMAKLARAEVTADYAWPQIAARTLDVYQAALVKGDDAPDSPAALEPR